MGVPMTSANFPNLLDPKAGLKKSKKRKKSKKKNSHYER